MGSVLRCIGSTYYIVDIIIALHDGMVGLVYPQNAHSELFPILESPKQGCVLARILFPIYLAAMLNEIPCESPGDDIRYRLDGGNFKITRLKSNTRTSESSIK